MRPWFLFIILTKNRSIYLGNILKYPIKTKIRFSTHTNLVQIRITPMGFRSKKVYQDWSSCRVISKTVESLGLLPLLVYGQQFPRGIRVFYTLPYWAICPELRKCVPTWSCQMISSPYLFDSWIEIWYSTAIFQWDHSHLLLL